MTQMIQKPETLQVRIIKKEQLTKTVILFSFVLENTQPLQFTAGQYGAFMIDEKTRRQYSFCSPPNSTTTFQMVIDTAPMGPGSRFFLLKNISDTVSCLAPLGIFVLDKTTHRKKIMVATGTGVAPFRSMILDYLEGRPPAGRQGTDDISLYWGMRHEGDVYWAGEFQELSIKYPNFRFVLTLSKPQDSWQGKRGRVTEHLIQEELYPEGSDYYLCGNRMMIKDIETQLVSKNVPLQQIHKEMYF
jgi:CDP-4-dehydro-6-deoxyglucose reductase, E3